METLLEIIKEYEDESGIKIHSDWSKKNIEGENYCKEILFDNIVVIPRKYINFLKYCKKSKNKLTFNLIKKFINISIKDHNSPLINWEGIKSDILINAFCIILYESWIYRGEIVKFEIEETYELIELLIYFGSDINKKDIFGKTAYSIIKDHYMYYIMYKDVIEMNTKMENQFINFLKYSNINHPYLIYMKEYLENKEETSKRLLFVKKCSKYFKEVDAGRKIARAVKKALNDQFVTTKLRYRIEEKKYLKLCKENENENEY